MHAQIDAGVTIDNCPDKYRHGNPSGSEDERKKHRYAERVGGMPRYKAVSTCSIVVYNIHPVFKIGVIRRAQPLKKRFKQKRRHLIANHKDKGKEQRCEDCLFPGYFVEKYKQDKEQDQRPYVSAGKGQHEIVQKERITAVEGKKKFALIR